jgi:hypothetical protein
MQDFLLSGGKPVGSRNGRAGKETRTISLREFQELLEGVSPGAQLTASPLRYRGEWYRRPDGSIFGVRRSEQNGITFDIIENGHPQIGPGYKVHKK